MIATPRFLRPPQWLNRITPLIADITVMALALFTAYTLRYNFAWARIRVEAPQIILQGSLLVAIHIAFLAVFGCYRLLWRFITVDDVPRFVYAIAWPTLFLTPVIALLPRGDIFRVPLSVLLLNAVFTLGGIMLMRSFIRLALNGGSRTVTAAHGRSRRIVIIGAGSTGSQVAREMALHQGANISLIGFVDDDPRKQRAILQGTRVMGCCDDLPKILRRHHITEVIVAITRPPQELLRKITAWCESCGATVRIVPEYYDIITGNVTVNRLRQIDISDLLGRAEGFRDDPSVLEFFSGKRVMITGAGGTIGGELARQVARMAPESLLLVERSENALYEIDRDLRTRQGASKTHALLADISDNMRMEPIIVAHKPHIILHAAAHKHVPLMQANPIEAIKNNILATQSLGELAIRHGVADFLLISTDKAVKPVSVMGATKRLAEHVIQHLNSKGATKFCAVRFGNVLGSSGSVVPLFAEQIKAGGPVTVTHPDMARYFMTTREAVRLVLHAATLSGGGEIFVLDMGKPVKITELAEMMIRLSGLRPHEDIAITYSGIRPGEKLFEELDISESAAVKTNNAHIFVGRAPVRRQAEVEQIYRELSGLAATDPTDNQAVRDRLLQLANDCAAG